MSTPKHAPIAYMGHVDSLGAVHAVAMPESELATKMHHAASDAWRFKPSTNTVTFWVKPSEAVATAVLDWLSRKGIQASVLILMPQNRPFKTPKVITGD